MKAQKFLLLLLVLLTIVGSSFAQAAPDRDGDGVPDSSDRCISDVGPASNNGCPVDTDNTPRATDVPPPDTDGDGTADPLDRCPNEAGDGANGGCPADSTNNASSPALTPELPLAAPTTGDCVVSTQGSSPVNIRQFPNVEAAVVGVISPNEWVEVLGKFDYGNLLFSQNGMGGNLPPEHQFPILGETPDPDYLVWFLVQDTDTNATGWVAEAVLRLGGDCSEFVGEADPDTVYLKYKMSDALITSFRGGVNVATGDINGDGSVDASDYELWRAAHGTSIPVFPNENPFIGIPLDPQAASDYLLELGDIKGESSDDAAIDPSQHFAQAPDGCELVENSDGTITPRCDDGGSPSSIIICTYQQLTEVGVYTQVCYSVEIPEGCVVNTSEAGVWHITCEETGDGVQVTPVGETDPILDIKWGEDNTVLIGLLLPAVQKVREAAAR